MTELLWKNGKNIIKYTLEPTPLCINPISKTIFDKIKVLLKEAKRLSEFRDTLLPRLMPGELKVREICQHGL